MGKKRRLTSDAVAYFNRLKNTDNMDVDEVIRILESFDKVSKRPDLVPFVSNGKIV